MSFLSVRNISKRFATTQAVDSISFSIEAGRIFAFLGPNGAGKTTSIRMMLGLTYPDSGSIDYHMTGDDYPSASTVGYLPEERGLYLDQTVRDNLIYLARLRGFNRQTASADANEWLDRLDLGERGNDKVETLSKGNQQKVQFIAAVQHRPDIAFLDEPFSGLDPVNQEKVLDILRELKTGGMTIVLSAHQMALVERLVDDLLLMSHGKMVLQGSLKEVLADNSIAGQLTITLHGNVDLDALNETRGVKHAALEDNRLSLSLEPDASLNDLLTMLTRQYRIESLHTESSTLHDVYLEVVAASEDGEVREESKAREESEDGR